VLLDQRAGPLGREAARHVGCGDLEHGGGLDD
jgi:hypothetical protein